ncbi:MAG: DUF167 domain-containing protein [Ignavibacteriae bacterium]|nr:MAG: DUF167 domain-containing protein [Ignavibacteriota bacterium]
MLIKVKVKPNAGRNEIKEISKDYFEVKVSVPPEKGKANERVKELLSSFLKVPKSRIELIRGETYKEKIFEIL